MADHPKFLLWDASDDRLRDMRSRIRRRIPDAIVDIFSTEEDAQAHKTLYGGTILDRSELGSILDLKVAVSEELLDSVIENQEEMKDDLRAMRVDLDAMLHIWRGDKDVPSIPFRVSELEKSRNWWNSELWKTLKWVLVTTAGALAYFLGRYFDKIDGK